MAKLIHNSYGKNQVRVTKVERDGARHRVYEFSVNVRLFGEFAAVYEQDDNALCIPTDTMKNTVYVVAKQTTIESPEQFATVLAQHFVATYPQVSATRIEVTESRWERIRIGGDAHDHAFTRAAAKRTASAQAGGDAPLLAGGVCELEVLKTTGSGFVGFHQDRYTTLQQDDDRIFATSVEAQWEISDRAADANAIYDDAVATILEVFATHRSPSVQSTMFLSARTLLDRIAAVQTVHMTMPNQHHILAKLEPFGHDNRNEVFVGTGEPFGLITATVERD